MSQSERLAIAIGNIKKMMHRHEPMMAVPKSEFIVLKTIYDSENSKIKVSDISTKLMISNAAISQVITSLESKKLVNRVMTKEDRRIVYITLTSEGKKIMLEAKEMLHQFMSILVKKLGTDDSEELIRIITKLEGLLEEGKVCHEINR